MGSLNKALGKDYDWIDTGVCSSDECGEESVRFGLCKRHYATLYRYGSVHSKDERVRRRRLRKNNIGSNPPLSFRKRMCDIQDRSMSRAQYMSEYNSRPVYLYIMKWGELYKVGQSILPQRRRSSLNTRGFRGIELLQVFPVERALGEVAERDAHIALTRYNVFGEWFVAPLDVLQQGVAIGIAQAEMIRDGLYFKPNYVVSDYPLPDPSAYDHPEILPRRKLKGYLPHTVLEQNERIALKKPDDEAA